jgi:hypothetical protein
MRTRCGTAGLDGGHDAALATRESIALRGAERFAVAAEDIRAYHLTIAKRGR